VDAIIPLVVSPVSSTIRYHRHAHPRTLRALYSVSSRSKSALMSVRQVAVIATQEIVPPWGRTECGRLKTMTPRSRKHQTSGRKRFR
jgi:hypothetical protein